MIIFFFFIKDKFSKKDIKKFYVFNFFFEHLLDTDTVLGEECELEKSSKQVQQHEREESSRQATLDIPQVDKSY